MRYIIYTIGIFILLLNSAHTFSGNPMPAENSADEFIDCLGAQGTLRFVYYENMSGKDLQTLYENHLFPQTPDGFEYIEQLSTPVRYNDNYGAMVKGFIRASATGNFKFNVTADEQAEFYLSTNSNPANKVLICSLDNAVTAGSYNSYASQTSANITLQSGNYYYFELYLKENIGPDYATIVWDRPNTAGTVWEQIPSTNLYDFSPSCESFCPPKGTPCNDGKSNTINDQQDGACNCVGEPTQPASCVGEWRNIKALYWDNIPTGNLSALQNSPNYPYMPNRAEILPDFSGPIEKKENYGSRVRAYLQVPVTGAYTFNIISTAYSRLYLDHNQTGTPTAIARIEGTVPVGNHNKYETQTSSTYQLQAGQFYYIELRHKAATGNSHFKVYWRTPFHRDNSWRPIQDIYLYDYTCDAACIPANLPCDDGNATTYDDKYNNNCECVGTPCPSGDCETFLAPERFEACGTTDEHSTAPDDSWLSCTTAPSPNPARGNNRHWIQYDFGSVITLHKSRIWNYNVASQMGKGFKDVVIDISNDGITWTQVGTYRWAKAPGSPTYSGFEGPDFGGANARYVLITALSSWSANTCIGFSEISFSTSTCPNVGTYCDDGNSNTRGDVINSNCECEGKTTLTNDCTTVDLFLEEGGDISPYTYSAQKTIRAIGTVARSTTTTFIAGTSITLKPGFHAAEGSDFLAKILPCSPGASLMAKNDSIDIAAKLLTITEEEEAGSIEISPDEVELNSIFDEEKTHLRLFPNPATSWTTIEFNLPKSTTIYLTVYDSSGKLVSRLVANQLYDAGIHSKMFPAHTIQAGVYIVTLQTEQEVLAKNMVVIGR